MPGPPDALVHPSHAQSMRLYCYSGTIQDTHAPGRQPPERHRTSRPTTSLHPRSLLSPARSACSRGEVFSLREASRFGGAPRRAIGSLKP